MFWLIRCPPIHRSGPTAARSHSRDYSDILHALQCVTETGSSGTDTETTQHERVRHLALVTGHNLPDKLRDSLGYLTDGVHSVVAPHKPLYTPSAVLDESPGTIKPLTGHSRLTLRRNKRSCHPKDLLGSPLDIAREVSRHVLHLVQECLSQLIKPACGCTVQLDDPRRPTGPIVRLVKTLYFRVPFLVSVGEYLRALYVDREQTVKAAALCIPWLDVFGPLTRRDVGMKTQPRFVHHHVNLCSGVPDSHPVPARTELGSKGRAPVLTFQVLGPLIINGYGPCVYACFRSLCLYLPFVE